MNIHFLVICEEWLDDYSSSAKRWEDVEHSRLKEQLGDIFEQNKTTKSE